MASGTVIALGIVLTTKRHKPSGPQTFRSITADRAAETAPAQVAAPISLAAYPLRHAARGRLSLGDSRPRSCTASIRTLRRLDSAQSPPGEILAAVACMTRLSRVADGYAVTAAAWSAAALSHDGAEIPASHS